MFLFSNIPLFLKLLFKKAPCLALTASIAFLTGCRKIYVVKSWIFAQQRNGALVLMILVLRIQISKLLKPLSSLKPKQFRNKRFTIRKDLLGMGLKYPQKY